MFFHFCYIYINKLIVEAKNLSLRQRKTFFAVCFFHFFHLVFCVKLVKTFSVVFYSLNLFYRALRNITFRTKTKKLAERVLITTPLNPFKSSPDRILLVNVYVGTEAPFMNLFRLFVRAQTNKRL